MENLLQFLSSVHPLSEGLVDYMATHIKAREIGKKEMLIKGRAHQLPYLFCAIRSLTLFLYEG